jgi:hypothetical protein
VHIAADGQFCLDNAFVLIDVALTQVDAVWLLVVGRWRIRSPSSFVPLVRGQRMIETSSYSDNLGCEADQVYFACAIAVAANNRSEKTRDSKRLTEPAFRWIAAAAALDIVL